MTCAFTLSHLGHLGARGAGATIEILGAARAAVGAVVLKAGTSAEILVRAPDFSWPVGTRRHNCALLTGSCTRKSE